MPNQRDPKKKMVAAYISEDDRRLLEKACAEGGFATITDFILYAIHHPPEKRADESTEEKPGAD